MHPQTFPVGDTALLLAVGQDVQLLEVDPSQTSQE